MTEERRVIKCDLRIEERADKTPVLIGYAAVFGKRSVDLGGFTEEVAPGAFSKSLRADDVIAVVEHDPALILGRTSAKTLTLSEDPSGLKMEIDLPDTSAGRDIRVSVQRGDIKGASFKFQTITDSWEMRDGVSHRTLIEARLFDVCPVANPAYPDTSIAMRSLDEWRLAMKPIETIGLFLQRQRQAEAFGW
jgi:hypothetical protein